MTVGTIAEHATPVLPRLGLSRNQLFWALHLGGWCGYGLVQYAGAIAWEKPSGYLTVVVVAAAAGLVLSAPLRWVNRYLWGRSPWVLLGGVVAVTYVLAVIWRLIVEAAYAQAMPEHADEQISLLYILVTAANASFVLLCWSGLYLGIHYAETLRRERERSLRSAALAQEAQFKMLRYQLNPHFLFNTLNSISTLILDGRNELANESVTRLSEFLRYTLDQDPMKRVTLGQEIEALNLYLTTERLRFGERLKIEFAVADDVRDALLPSLLLQPLIENAVKYAIAPREPGGRIRIEALQRDGQLEIAVADDGPGLPAGQLGAGRGVGLRNTRERLVAIYGDRHRFATRDARPGLRVEIAIPLERDLRP